MHNAIYLLLRRMRLPLIVLISVYAVSILGLTLIPGIDDQGNPWRMDFFHAVYFVSFLGSTIGLGEIPYPLTDPQRMWTIFIIYAAVFSWLYAIGAVLTLIQDAGFRRALITASIARKIRHQHEPFYLICGYGDASRLLVHELIEHRIHCVVIDSNQEKLHNLEVEDLPDYVPAVQGDATDPNTLLLAGIKHPKCKGLIALTGNDDKNLSIAISSKLLAPDLPLFCQSDSADTAANLDSFGTDYIIDPFEIFASRFAMIFHSPSMYLVYEWMTAVHNAPLSEFKSPPSGTWVLCGFGRFGKAARSHLSKEDVQTSLIEADVSTTNAPEHAIEGRGTEAHTLQEAGIESAAGIIAGTDNDTNNLSILITARDLNPKLFTVGRQNSQNMSLIFDTARIDLTMQPGIIAAKHILGLILAPLLADFLKIAHYQDEEWANILVSRVVGIIEDVAPETWDIEISPFDSPAVFDCLIRSEEVLLRDICSDPLDRSQLLPSVPLLIKRDEGDLLLPDMDEPLQAGDRLLFCGREDVINKMYHLTRDHKSLYYVRTGIDQPDGIVWRWLTERQQRSA